MSLNISDNREDGLLYIVMDGSTSLDFAAHKKILAETGLKINSVQIEVPAIGNTAIIRARNAVGLPVFPFLADTSREGLKYLYGKNYKLYIVGNEVTNGTIIVVDYEPR